MEFLTPSATVAILKSLPRRTTARTIAMLSSTFELPGIEERTINFDFIEGETAQIAERGISGSEIVHYDSHAEAADFVKDI